MPSESESGTPPSTRKSGGVIVGGGREVGAALARKIGAISPQLIIAGAVARTPAAALARRITGQDKGKDYNRVSRQLQRWAKGERQVTTKGIDNLIADFPNVTTQVPAIAQAKAVLGGAARPALALPPGATLRIHARGTSRFQSGAGEPEIRNNHGASFSLSSYGADSDDDDDDEAPPSSRGGSAQRSVDRALGDPLAYWLARFQSPAPGIEYLSIDDLNIRIDW